MRLLGLSAIPTYISPPPAPAGIRPYLIPLGFSHRRPLNSSGPLGCSFAGIACCERKLEKHRVATRWCQAGIERAQRLGLGFRGCHRSGGRVARRARWPLARRQRVCLWLAAGQKARPWVCLWLLADQRARLGVCLWLGAGLACCERRFEKHRVVIRWCRMGTKRA